MSRPLHPGKTARENKGWLMANKWLLARRFSQLSILIERRLARSGEGTVS